jgi:two-component system, cell cycle response regulator DivK
VSKRILVVEDQEDSRRILRDLLSSADYEMTEAVNGEQALAAVAKQRPDLILDIQMPVLDGYEATRRIKADPALKDVPIIVVTSYASSGGDEAKARAAGCDDFVPKPFSPRQLLARIRKLLS